MAKRLIKVAKELNVGISTIVEFLNKNGFEINDKPTAKVTNEMESKLYEEFRESVAIKEKADQLIIGTRPNVKKETVAVSSPPPPPPPPVQETKSEPAPEPVIVPEPPVKAPPIVVEEQPVVVDIKPEPEPAPVVEKPVEVKLPEKELVAEELPVIAKETPVQIKKDIPSVAEEKTIETVVPSKPEVKEKSQEIKTESPVLPKLKILGKINLDAKKKGGKARKEMTQNKKNAKKEEPKVIQETKKEVVTPTPLVNNTPSDPVKELKNEPKEKAPPIQKQKDKPAPKKSNQKEQIRKVTPARREQRPAQNRGERQQRPNASNSNKNISNKDTSNKDAKRKEPLNKGVSDKTKPTTAPNVEKGISEESANKTKKIEKVVAPVDDQVIRAEAPKLKGTKIVGTIDIGKYSKRRSDKAKPVASSDANRQKRKKRPRKRVEGSDGNRSSGGRGQNSDGGNRQGQRGGTNTNNRQGQGQGQGGGNRQGQGGGNRSGGGGGNRSGGGGGNRSGGGNRTSGGSGRGGSNRSSNNRGRGNAPSRGRGRRDEVKEVSQKEIEDKIKSTMARLEGRGGKKRQRIRRDKRESMRNKKEELQEQERENIKLQVTEFISVSELASLMDVPVTDVITTCMNLDIIVSINQRLDAEIIELLAEEFNHEIEFISAEEQILEEEEVADAPEDLRPRAPIVTVMGHVDHGKTSLLDHIRKAKVADGEAGGITQHIGAYEVKVGPEDKRITFLDTPGHEAFTAMRARGAKVTDIAVIIIAADDSIMPQTKEAISHAQAAGVPIIFAINKIDKPGANPDRIKQELSGMNLLIEEWGGEYQSQDISAKNGTNIDALLEEILLKAEMLELKANPDRQSSGVVLEASLDKGRGYVAKALVLNGTLKIGDPVVAGSHSGKIKAMFNERGKRVKIAGPSAPVLILGLSGAPQAGEKFKVTDTEPEARQIASKRAQINREQTNRASKRISLDEIARRLALGSFKELNLIVKGDVDGSIEALSDSLIKQSIESVQVNVIHKAVGQIIESDVLLASASDAIIIGFQVRPSLGARKLAEREGVQIKTYSIIYEAIEEIRSAIEGMLEPTKEEKILGEVEVREVYKISKVGTIAGCFVQDGIISRNSHIRLIRNGIVVFPTKEGAHGEVSSLKRFKDDAKEVKKGLECGVTIRNYNDIKVGDVIEAYEIVEVKQTLQTIKNKR